MTLHQYPKVEHDSPEWHDLRRGIVTASVVSSLLTYRSLTGLDFACPACGAQAQSPCVSKRAGSDAPIKTLHPERIAVSAADTTPPLIEPAANPESRALTALLVAERITGWTHDNYVSFDMQRGHDDEPRAVKVYSEHWTNVTTCGFMVRDDWGFRIGYSPDGLVGDEGLFECKSRSPKKHLLTVLADAVPVENMGQLQCGLLVSGRPWIDYVSYSGGLALWVKRVYPDPRWQEAIVAAVAAFEEAAEQMKASYTKAVAGLPMTERTPDYSDIRF